VKCSVFVAPRDGLGKKADDGRAQIYNYNSQTTFAYSADSNIFWDSGILETTNFKMTLILKLLYTNEY
jgi:hypothetical protein